MNQSFIFVRGWAGFPTGGYKKRQNTPNVFAFKALQSGGPVTLLRHGRRSMKLQNFLFKRFHLLACRIQSRHEAAEPLFIVGLQVVLRMQTYTKQCQHIRSENFDVSFNFEIHISK